MQNTGLIIIIQWLQVVAYICVIAYVTKNFYKEWKFKKAIIYCRDNYAKSVASKKKSSKKTKKAIKKKAETKVEELDTLKK